jgi:4-hydroxy-2-oxoheptanedioate aldolase
VMLETRAGVANAREIMSVPDVDGCLIGPNDLAVSYGYGPELSEVPAVVEEAIQEILDASLAADKVPGIQTYSADSANRYLHRGFRFLGLGSDVRLVGSAARAMLAALERV